MFTQKGNFSLDCGLASNSGLLCRTSGPLPARYNFFARANALSDSQAPPPCGTLRSASFVRLPQATLTNLLRSGLAAPRRLSAASSRLAAHRRRCLRQLTPLRRRTPSPRIARRRRTTLASLASRPRLSARAQGSSSAPCLSAGRLLLAIYFLTYPYLLIIIFIIESASTSICVFRMQSFIISSFMSGIYSANSG